MIERLKKLKEDRAQFITGHELRERLKTDYNLRSEVETLYKYYFNASVSGCSNCYHDAYMELINLNIEEAMVKQECLFELFAGAVLYTGDREFNCSNANITNELALYHIKANPACIDQFQKLPDNLNELLEGVELPEGVKVVMIEAKSEDAQEENSVSQNEQFERALAIVRAVILNDLGAAIELFTKDELIEFIGSYNLDIEVTDEMSEDEVRAAVLVKIDDEDEDQEDELPADNQQNGLVDNTKDIVQSGFNEPLPKPQEEIENDFVIEIAEKLKAGILKKDIQEGYKSMTKLGEKNLTVRFLAELITRAEELIK